MTGFKRIEHIPTRKFVNERGNDIELHVQGGNCTGMGGNPERIMQTVHYMMRGPHSTSMQAVTIIEAAHLRDMLTELLARLPDDPTRDKCQMCKGARGGTPGNENIVYDMTVCDYCHADIMTATDAVRDETLVAAGQIAKMVATERHWGVAGSLIATALDSVRIKDGKWQSVEAMRLWAEATGACAQEQYPNVEGPGPGVMSL